MIKTLPLLALLPVWFAIVPQVNAQAPPLAAGAAIEPLQIIVDYGQAQPKRRETLRGVMEPIALPANQQAAITLQFLKKRAGSPVTIGRLDGGEIDVQGPVTISSDGSVLFHFSAGGRPGLYRLVIDGPERYEISLYAFDPNRPPRSPGSSGH
jgi:hypothetical protein